MIRYTLEQRVFPYDTYEKYGYAGKCRRKFRRKFRDERVPSRQTIHNLVNKLRTTGLLLDEKTKHKRRVLTEEKLDATGASSNPRTEEELEENIRKEISNTAAENLRKVNQNLFRQCEDCLRVEGKHFQHHL
jgi:RNA polymerase-binding transcription factor DksA